MITKIKIHGYRIYGDLTLHPNKDLNILVGGNDAGKSTQAIGLALNGRISGRFAQEKLNPYWFNKAQIDQVLEDRASMTGRFWSIAVIHDRQLSTHSCPSRRVAIRPIC